MKVRFVFYVAVGAIAVTAFGALAEAQMARKAPTVATETVTTPLQR